MNVDRLLPGTLINNRARTPFLVRCNRQYGGALTTVGEFSKQDIALVVSVEWVNPERDAYSPAANNMFHAHECLWVFAAVRQAMGWILIYRRDVKEYWVEVVHVT